MQVADYFSPAPARAGLLVRGRKTSGDRARPGRPAGGPASDHHLLNSVTSPSRVFAALLIAYEARQKKSRRVADQDVFPVCNQLGRQLVVQIGDGGFRALLVRSLALATTGFVITHDGVVLIHLRQTDCVRLTTGLSVRIGQWEESAPEPKERK